MGRGLDACCCRVEPVLFGGILLNWSAFIMLCLNRKQFWRRNEGSSHNQWTFPRLVPQVHHEWYRVPKTASRASMSTTYGLAVPCRRCFTCDICTTRKLWIAVGRGRYKIDRKSTPSFLLGPFLSNNFFQQLFFPPDFPLFFFREKPEKQETQETFPKLRNWTEGKIFGTLRIPTFGKRNRKYGNIPEYKKLRGEKNL